MNERIDVLAVMRRDLGDAHQYRCGQLKPRDARAAVAELIAKMEQIERLSREADWQLINAGGQPTHLVLGDIARAALARMQGECA